MNRPRKRSLTLDADLVWPLGLALMLTVVVLVNVVYIWVAVGGADEVAPAYVAGER